MTQAAGYSDTYYVWNAPYTYIYMTPTATFEKGLDDFNLFMLNTKVSDGFIIASSNFEYSVNCADFKWYTERTNTW